MKLIIILLIVAVLFTKGNKYLHHLAILILALLFSSRGETIPDTIPYMEMYKLGTSYMYGVEQWFLTMCDIASQIGLTFRLFLFLLVFLMIEIWYICTCILFKRNNARWMAVLMLSYFGVYFFGVVLRSAIAISLCYIALTILVKKKIKIKYLIVYYFIVFCAINFHVSATLFVIAPFLFIDFPSKILYILVSIALVFFVTSTILQLDNFYLYLSKLLGFGRLNYYLEDSDVIGVGYLHYSYVGISYFAIYCKTKLGKKTDIRLYNLFLNLFVVATFIDSLVWHIPAGTRLPMNFLFFEYVIVFYIIFKSKIINEKESWFFASTFSGISLLILLHTFPLLFDY